MGWMIRNGDVLGQGAQDLALSGQAIADAPPADARVFDATGLIVAPGLCDVHGDAFERNLSPRPGVTFSPEVALIETDRQLIANGITSAWLALTISWEPGLRGLDTAHQILSALEKLRPVLGCDIRVQLRWEVFAFDAADQIAEWMTMSPRPVLAFNDHLTGMVAGGREVKKLDQYAARAGVTSQEYRDLIYSLAKRSGEVPGLVAGLTQAAAAAGVVCFAHDEKNAGVRRENREIGITVSEFPLSADAAHEAVAAGEPTILGAPNVLRGGSHIGALDAAPAIADGLCSVLASDYYYPSQLQAAARLEADGVVSLAEAWPLISANAAQACGLDDRGRLEAGQRGDIIALVRHGNALSVEAVFCAGQPVMIRDAARLN